MGKLIVVGIGPGDYENMTVRADRALQNCDTIIGYHVYVNLVKERYPDKAFLTTPLPPTFCILSQRKIGIFVAESRGKMDRKRGVFAQKWGKNFSKGCSAYKNV